MLHNPRLEVSGSHESRWQMEVKHISAISITVVEHFSTKV